MKCFRNFAQFVILLALLGGTGLSAQEATPAFTASVVEEFRHVGSAAEPFAGALIKPSIPSDHGRVVTVPVSDLTDLDSAVEMTVQRATPHPWLARIGIKSTKEIPAGMVLYATLFARGQAGDSSLGGQSGAQINIDLKNLAPPPGHLSDGSSDSRTRNRMGAVSHARDR